MVIVALWPELQADQVPSQLLCCRGCDPGLHKCRARQELVLRCNFQKGWEEPGVTTEGVSPWAVWRGVLCVTEQKCHSCRALHGGALPTHSTGVVGPGIPSSLVMG